MAERIEKIKYFKTDDKDDDPAIRENELFINSPGEFLCHTIVKELKKVCQWKSLFGESMDAYRRMDYGITTLPAMRVYQAPYVKAYESWFIESDVKMDIIYPASIRREEQQQIPSTVSLAMLQQFRRPGFFEAVSAGVPGLNELGKRFAADLDLGFNYGGDDIVPLTQITLNFKLDLRVWDQYLEDTYRTKEEPFDRTLKDLERIVTTIKGLNDDETQNVSVVADQKIEGLDD